MKFISTILLLILPFTLLAMEQDSLDIPNKDNEIFASTNTLGAGQENLNFALLRQLSESPLTFKKLSIKGLLKEIEISKQETILSRDQNNALSGFSSFVLLSFYGAPAPHPKLLNIAKVGYFYEFIEDKPTYWGSRATPIYKLSIRGEYLDYLKYFLEIFPKINNITIHGNGTLSNALLGCYKLASLIVKKNKILHHHDSFNKTLISLPYLTTLELYRSEFSLEPFLEQLKQLTNLEKLTLVENKFEYWAEASLTPNAGTRLLTAVLGLTNLQHLSMKGQPLTVSLPTGNSLTSLRKLKTLHLPQNGITEFSPEIYALSTLTSLDLSRNLITSCPPGIQRLSWLTMLNLSHNLITSLPEDIQQLNYLTRLEVIGLPLQHTNLVQLKRALKGKCEVREKETPSA